MNSIIREVDKLISTPKVSKYQDYARSFKVEKRLYGLAFT
jgi:hypothetical protein